MDGPTSFPELLRPWVREKLVKIRENEVEFTFNNSLISLAQIRTEEDLEKAQGREKHVLVCDEATQLPRRHIESLRGWVRMPKEMKVLLPQQIGHLYTHVPKDEIQDLFPRVIYTANPIGASVSYFRKQFVEPRKPFEIERAADKEGGFLRQYIPSRIDDNPSADKEAQRRRLSSFGEATAKALIEGTWDQPTGDYFPEWDEDKHVCPDFIPPKEWFKFRTLDLGYAEPTAVYWWCVADGSEVIGRKGEKIWFPSGSLVAYREWYVCDKENPDKGLRMRNNDIAQGVLNRTPEATSNITLTDSLPFQDRGSSNGQNNKKYTVADVFGEEGVPLMKGNTARIHGWSQLRDRLIGIDDVALIYLSESCKYARDYIPALPYSESNPEDAAEHGETTHSCDAIRLACTARPLTIKKKEGLTGEENKSMFSVSKIISTTLHPPRRKLR